MSAYARVKYTRQFFVRYNVGDKKSRRDELADGAEEILSVTGQLLTKSLLSILKHRTMEKSVNRCEFSIVEGASSDDNDGNSDEHDSLESRLIVRLHCKHGVIKTHRLLLLTPTTLMAPGIPDTLNESHLTIGPRSIKDMIEHFPSSKGTKSDPQLVWTFDDLEVHIKSVETFIDTKGAAQLSTELTISADEFDVYDVYCLPMTIAFHLREFNATIAYAESMSLPLDLRFTDSTSPLFIDVEDDNSETLFVISTSQVHGMGGGASQVRSSNGTDAAAENRKRGREDEEVVNVKNNGSKAAEKRKPLKVVQRTDVADFARVVNSTPARSQSTRGSMPPPPLPLPRSPLFTQASQAQSDSKLVNAEPLFLPASQLSQSAEDAIRESGLGIEDMDAAEFEAMLEGDGEEVEFLGSNLGSQVVDVKSEWKDVDMEDDSFYLYDETELEPTQDRLHSGDKTFKPLFED